MRNFNFSLYRLNIEDIDDMLSDDKPRLRGDHLIYENLRKAISADYDDTQSTSSSLYEWGLRELQDFSSVLQNRRFVTCTLARSLLERTGTVVTEKSITEGRSASYPPLAETIFLVFDFSRHLVAVERNSVLQAGGHWKKAFARITGKAAESSNYASYLTLDEVPGHSAVFSLLASFSRVTRIRLTVRVPNPELSAYTKRLSEELRADAVRELGLDIKSPQGLACQKESPVYAALSLAEAGYKKDEVKISGIKDGVFRTEETGSEAVNGNISMEKNAVKAITPSASSEIIYGVFEQIASEIDRIHPIEHRDDVLQK
jgi:hypothetical protein